MVASDLNVPQIQFLTYEIIKTLFKGCLCSPPNITTSLDFNVSDRGPPMVVATSEQMPPGYVQYPESPYLC